MYKDRISASTLIYLTETKIIFPFSFHQFDSKANTESRIAYFLFNQMEKVVVLFMDWDGYEKNTVYTAACKDFSPLNCSGQHYGM